MAQAAIMLRNGLLVAFPTETVYGLGADARNDRAVAAIFEAKGRPSFNPLIIHVADAAQADRYAVLDDRARSLASQFWPGPLTLVMPRRSDADISWLASAGMETIALRCPSHPVAQHLLRAFGGPVAAPSANLSGTVSATTAGHVAESLTSGVAMVLDGGPARHGLESTIVGLTGPEAMLLRPGAIERAMIEKITGPLHQTTTDANAPLSPGRLTRHYATDKPLRLNARHVESHEALLAFGKPLAGSRHMRNLSEAESLVEAASRLFAMLRELDGTDASGIAVMEVPDTGLGEAINDRLRRAAIRAQDGTS
jgi:L-threonylcarbamoyladenylate synthase